MLKTYVVTESFPFALQHFTCLFAVGLHEQLDKLIRTIVLKVEGHLYAYVRVSLVDILFVDWNLTMNAMLVLGLADAAGEVVGTRWGRRKFAVRDLFFGSTHHRSWEGSIAVLLTTIMVLFVRGIDPLHAIACAAAVALTEAWSPRSCDNFTVPLTCGCCLGLLTVFY